MFLEIARFLKSFVALMQRVEKGVRQYLQDDENVERVLRELSGDNDTRATRDEVRSNFFIKLTRIVCGNSHENNTDTMMRKLISMVNDDLRDSTHPLVSSSRGPGRKQQPATNRSDSVGGISQTSRFVRITFLAELTFLSIYRPLHVVVFFYLANDSCQPFRHSTLG